MGLVETRQGGHNAIAEVGIKDSDSRARAYIERFGRRCWEVDILPADVIEQAIDADIHQWLDADLWRRRDTEINRARALL